MLIDVAMIVQSIKNHETTWSSRSVSENERKKRRIVKNGFVVWKLPASISVIEEKNVFEEICGGVDGVKVSQESWFHGWLGNNWVSIAV